ncbi:MAG: DNA translocase FtsK 4TM domain-containing protein [Nitrospirae bacterium]|nr:DNA translocase FtsK 4TM domain-containing protein [Nitrospirota bacterium]
MDEIIAERKNKIRGAVAVVSALLCGMCLATYNKWDPSPFTYTRLPVHNYGGVVGSYISDVTITLCGTTAYLVPVILFIYGLRRLLGSLKKPENLVGSLLLLLSLSMTLALVTDTFGVGFVKGGLIGLMIIYFLKTALSIVVAFILSLSALYASILLLVPVNASSFFMPGDKIGTDLEAAMARNNKDRNTGERNIRDRNTGQRDMAEQDDSDNDIKIVDHTIKEPEHEEDDREKKGEREVKVRLPVPIAGRYVLPTVDLLSREVQEGQSMSKDELVRGAAILSEILSDFGVEGKVSQVHPGPIITMFEFEPAPGVKISKVVSLSDDLGRAMGGIKVRVSLIPGKTPIGIEVPNEKRSTVTLREIIASDKFTKRSSLLTMSLGKDIYGNPIVEDLSRMPHLLVAGTTGSGKSVAINAMIMSILYKAKPSEVKMLMIDPKLLELSIYEGIPHLISHVITNPKEASEALKKMLLEMERRYRLIAEQGARNIEMYNASVGEEEKLSYIIVIIDELADLMFTAAKNVEDSIVRLAQMARASGIHLIVATQRPSVDVITGIIKANFPSRIAFMVSSKVDSRTILDTHGAEKLLGRGDMLLLSPGARIMRVHGAFVKESEIKAVTDFVKSQGAPDYSLFDDLVADEAVKSENAPEDRDEVYKEVIKYAQSVGEVSISSIQRRFKIGYNRAARIMEMMEEDGLVGAPKGAGKPRNFVSN